MQSTQKIRIAIVGGGIGGLTLAVALSHLGLDESMQVDIYESAEKLTQVGAGIGLWPRGWEIVKDLNMENDMAAYLAPGQGIPSKDILRPSLLLKKADQSKEENISDLVFPGGAASFHRADVLKALLANISPRIHVHLGSRLASFVETETGVELNFKNGTTAHCDILVGADGINSVVRRGFLAKEYNLSPEESARAARPIWTGSMAYRTIIESKLVRDRDPQHPSLSRSVSHSGKNSHIVSYPISNGKEINVVVVVSEPEKENTPLDATPLSTPSADYFSEKFKNWCPEVKYITEHIVNPSVWPVEMVKPLEKYGSGRTLLLGDSAHAMPPHLGSGAGQAIEDAYILAHLLSASELQRLPSSQRAAAIAHVIQVYSAVRQPLGNFVARASLEQGKNYELAGPEFKFADVREGDAIASERLEALNERIIGLLKWTWETSIKDDLKRALDML